MKRSIFLITIIFLFIACDKKDEALSIQNRQSNLSLTVYDAQSGEEIETHEYHVSLSKGQKGNLAFRMHGADATYLSPSDITIQLKALEIGRYTIGSEAELAFNAYEIGSEINIEANAGFIDIEDGSIGGTFTVSYSERDLLFEREKYRLEGHFNGVEFD